MCLFSSSNVSILKQNLILLILAIITIIFKDGSLLLTSSAFVKPLSSLWRIGETQEHMINFPDEYFVEFNKTVQDRIIGTQGSKATVFL